MAAVDRPVVKPRPVYLNLFAIRMPLPAVVSILHRASGALLFVIGIPLVLCDAAARAGVAGSLGARCAPRSQSPLAKLVAVVLAWAFIHHLLRRHPSPADGRARRRGTAVARAAPRRVTLVLAIVLTLAIAVRLW